MSESGGNRELGGLARSIDALFSQGRAPGPTDADPPEEATQVDADAVAEPSLEMQEPGFDPDPFETLAAASDTSDTALEAEPPPDPGAGFELDPHSAEWSAQEGLESAEAMEADLGPPPDLADDLPVDEPSPVPPPAELAAAVEAFLAGHPRAGDEVRGIAAKMRERLALDPLADAAERLVLVADDDPGDPALDMAVKIVNPAVASRLVQRMAHEEDAGRRAGYILIAQRLGLVMANAFKGALTDATDGATRRAYHEGLIAMGEASRPVIEAMVEDENRFLVQNGVAILGEMGGEGAAELVTSALANTDFRVRREALAALAKLGGEDSGQLVLASLDDGNVKVRAAAAEAAGKLGLERALRHMLALLDDESVADEDKVAVQVQVLRGLGHLGDPGAVQAIEKRAVGSLFSRPPTEVRVAAYQALHAIGTPHARELIQKARDDKDPVVRTTVRALPAE